MNLKYSQIFEENIEKTETCWLWVGSQNSQGYGTFKGKYAHRLSWERSNGRIPRGFFIYHKCDRPRCVNPDHLFLGTPSDNSKGAELKGRRKHIVINLETQKKYERRSKLISAHNRYKGLDNLSNL